MALENHIVHVGGERWKIRTCRSLKDALDTIAHARCLGSVGGADYIDSTRMGGSVICLADVIKVNSDNSERKPYQQGY